MKKSSSKKPAAKPTAKKAAKPAAKKAAKPAAKKAAKPAAKPAKAAKAAAKAAKPAAKAAKPAAKAAKPAAKAAKPAAKAAKPAKAAKAPAAVPGIPTMDQRVIPYLTVKDAGATLEFYKNAFGMVEVGSMGGPDGKLMHAHVTHEGHAIMFGPETPAYGNKSPVSLGGSPMTIMIYYRDVDAAYARAIAAGAKSVKEPEDQFYGDRTATVLDLDHHIWMLAQQKKVFSYEDMKNQMPPAPKAEAQGEACGHDHGAHDHGHGGHDHGHGEHAHEHAGHDHGHEATHTHEHASTDAHKHAHDHAHGDAHHAHDHEHGHDGTAGGAHTHTHDHSHDAGAAPAEGGAPQA